MWCKVTEHSTCSEVCGQSWFSEATVNKAGTAAHVRSTGACLPVCSQAHGAHRPHSGWEQACNVTYVAHTLIA